MHNKFSTYIKNDIYISSARKNIVFIIKLSCKRGDMYISDMYAFSTNTVKCKYIYIYTHE